MSIRDRPVLLNENFYNETSPRTARAEYLRVHHPEQLQNAPKQSFMDKLKEAFNTFLYYLCCGSESAADPMEGDDEEGLEVGARLAEVAAMASTPTTKLERHARFEAAAGKEFRESILYGSRRARAENKELPMLPKELPMLPEESENDK